MGQNAKEISGNTSHERGEYSVFLLLPGWIVPGLNQPPTPEELWGEMESTLSSSLCTNLGNRLCSHIPVPVDFNLVLAHERKGYLCPPSPFSEQVACGLQYCVSNTVTYNTVK